MKISNLLILAIALFISGCTSKPVENASPESPGTILREERFKTIEPTAIAGNPIEILANQWMLVTAGDKSSYNTMTAAWGTVGNLWSKPVAICYIHPDRYTFSFIEKSEYYTLCFFDQEYLQALVYCGSHSGKDHPEKNKAEVAGLTPLYTDNGAVYYKEAYLVIECKKLYSDAFDATNFNADVTMTSRDGSSSVYNEQEKMHEFYIGEIINCKFREPVTKPANMKERTKEEAVFTVIHERKSVREFIPGKKISEENINKIVRAGMAAPSGRDARPWEIVVIDDREVLDALAEQLPYAKMLAQAPQAMVICGNTEASSYWYVDCSAVTENILLAVEALGLGAVWTAAYPYEERMNAVKNSIGLPDHIAPLCVLPMGYPAGENQPKEKYDAKKVHYNKW